MSRFSSALLVLLLATACGGGGGGTDSAPLPNPQIALLLVSGHEFSLLNEDAPNSYLHEELGPQMASDLESAGYSVQVGYFVDHPTETDAGGYVDLVSDMNWIRDNWVDGRATPTRVIVVAHSHGGTWATAAIREVSDLPIRMQVALDHSSWGWGTVGHNSHDAVMGGDPRDAYTIASVGACPDDAGLWNDVSTTYDLEDVVFPSVQSALEVRAGQTALGALSGEPYDEKWNARLDGTFTGLACYYANSTHREVRETTGTTYPVVLEWILTGLALD